jgi:CheY-like chemotaxis protein/DNA-binding XRE family transcriptional regulator
MGKADDKKMFGTSVKVWRELRGITQETLAARADLHRTYISDVERGARNLSLKSITRLAGALDISVAALFPPARENKIPAPQRGSIYERKLVDILLVEDNADDVDLTAQAFKRAHFINLVFIARDGEEALDYLFCRGEYAHRRVANHPDVILLDLNLPKVSGLEILHQIKADKRTSMIPIVVLTSSQMFSDIEECQRLGAASYLVKPVNFHSLSRITPHLNLEWALFKQAEIKPLPEPQLPADAPFFKNA